MDKTMSATDVEAMAALADVALTGGGPVPPFTDRFKALTTADAYRVTAALRARRVAQGRRPVGRKIGFTNRTIWPRYGVSAPIWGDMWADTVYDAAIDLPLAGLAEARIEPEIAFGIARTPEPGMNPDALIGCLAWAAHGFEIVQSPFPGWSFKTPDCIVAGGLHGALILGPRVEIGPDWRDALEIFSLSLACDGEVRERGHASAVLGGPLHALSHLVTLLADDPVNPSLAPGEIVTTGTITDAWPVAPGQHWSTTLAGVDLPGMHIAFV